MIDRSNRRILTHVRNIMALLGKFGSNPQPPTADDLKKSGFEIRERERLLPPDESDYVLDMGNLDTMIAQKNANNPQGSDWQKRQSVGEAEREAIRQAMRQAYQGDLLQKSIEEHQKRQADKQP